jgi:hypothetical protein
MEQNSLKPKQGIATIARIESFLNMMVGHISRNEEYIEKLHQIRFSM